MKRVVYHLFALVVILVHCPLPALASACDTVACGDSARMRQLVYVSASERFRPQQLIAPAALVAAGFFGVYNSTAVSLKEDIADGFTRWRKDRPVKIDDYIQYLPAAAYLGLGAVGVPGRHPLRERLAAGVTAYVAMAAVTNIVKYTVRERRPDSDSRNSFPSGHTATVFTGAELIRLEYGTWPAVGAYTMATAVAFLRLYNGRHWINDVLAGAGIGIVSARLGYWMLPYYRRWFGWENRRNAPVVAAVPAYDPSTSTFTLACAISF